MDNSLIFRTDSYKMTHWLQVPKGTTEVHSYLESRGGQYEYNVFFGLMYHINTYLLKPITQKNIDDAERFCELHFGDKKIFNREGWEYILKEYGGFLPLEIKAVKEGEVVPAHNVLMTIKNTDEKCYWLTNYVESLFMKMWASITIATSSFYMRNMLDVFADRTGKHDTKFKMHDFGYRGVSSEESAGILGMSHLTSFYGSDNVLSINYIKECGVYSCDENYMPAFSVPASEHSIATSYGKENEKEYLIHMLKTFPKGIVSVVADSYNVFDFCKMIVDDDEIYQMVMEREGTLVIRPDSGEPIRVIKECLDILCSRECQLTERGFKLLPNNIRILQSDGIDIHTTFDILYNLEKYSYASDNIVFGSGGGLLQKFNRDTNKFAIKCSSVIINGKQIDVQKNPITDSGKKSKKGYLKLVKDDNGYRTLSSVDNKGEFEQAKDEMVVYYCVENYDKKPNMRKFGTTDFSFKFEDIRERIRNSQYNKNVYDMFVKEINYKDSEF